MITPVLLVGAPVAAMGEAEMCFGQAATITGKPRQELIKGTKRPDVIVTNGARGVDARDGDDLVCSTGEAPDDFISLGPGADRFLGSSSDEIVVANDEAAGEVDRDTVDMGGGNDVVTTGGEGSGAGAGEDVVALGEGRDLLRVTGPVSAATLVGGRGRDEILLWSDLPRAVTIDNRREELILGGEVVMRWSSFQDFLSLAIIEGPFTFRGTSLPEGILFPFFLKDRWKVDVRMGGGRDRVTFSGGAHGSRIDGGRGADRLRPEGSGGVIIYGRAGNDRLFGSDAGDDILIGGRGYDIADGGGGSDRCKAEVRSDCES